MLQTVILVMLLLLGAVGCSDQASSATGDSSAETGPQRAASTGANTESVGKAAEEGVRSDRTKSDVTPVPTSTDRDQEKLVDKSFDDIKFEMDKEAPFERSMLTPEIEALSDNRIRIRGYILPTAQRRGFRHFVLVRDNQECCFGPGAALYDCIVVKMLPGKTAEFSIRPVTVEGRFQIEEFAPLGKHLAVFRIDGESVK